MKRLYNIILKPRIFNGCELVALRTRDKKDLEASKGSFIRSLSLMKIWIVVIVESTEYNLKSVEGTSN